MRKTLGVCGDSFMATKNYEEGVDNGHGKHFTEILAKKLDCDLITYARGGCSNQAIRLQIDEIIKLLNKLNFFLFKTVSKDILDCCQLLIKIAYEKQLEYTSSQTEKIDNFFNLIDYLGANI